MTEDWRDLAACLGTDPDEWFPRRGGRSVIARRICFKCPVKLECLAEAMAAGEEWGIWGGRLMSESAQRRERLRDAA